MKVHNKKIHNKSCPKIQFVLILDKYFKSCGNITANLITFWHGLLPNMVISRGSR